MNAYPMYRLREPAYDLIIVSPHMDDAVYSCAGQIVLARAARKRVLILTVFGNGNDQEMQGEGVFGDVQTRRQEERAAIERLDVDQLWLNLPDLLVRPKSLRDLVDYTLPLPALSVTPLLDQMFAAVSEVCASLRAVQGELWFPLAIGGHPDHRLVYQVGLALASAGVPVACYEDVPYALVPALRNERLRQLGLHRPDALLQAAREAHDFAFAHAPAWQRPAAWVAVLMHTAMCRAVVRSFGPRVPVLHERDLEERSIEDVLEQKLAAMRAYASQTAFFFPDDARIAERLSSHGPHIERLWRLRGAGGHALGDPAEQARARARLEATFAAAHRNPSAL